MIRRPPISTRTDTLFPYTTRFRSLGAGGRRFESCLPDHRSARAETEDPLQRPRQLLPLGGIEHRVGDGANGSHIVDVEIVELREDERSEEHTSELQSLMRISYAVFCLKKKNSTHTRKLHKTI